MATNKFIGIGAVFALCGAACGVDDALGDAQRLSPVASATAEVPTKTVWEYCEECYWFEDYGGSDGQDPADPYPPDEGHGDDSPGDAGTDAGTVGGSDGDSGGGYGFCAGECPARDFDGLMVEGECVETLPEVCECMYEVPTDQLKVKVLVTGFADMNPPTSPKQLYVNPSGLLLTGNTTDNIETEPKDGPLPAWLSANAAKTDCGVDVEYTFKVLPTLWGIAESIDYCEYDVVINIGVGGENQDELDLERNAKNKRSTGTDAAGNHAPAGPIDPQSGPTVAPYLGAGVNARINAQDGTAAGEFTVSVKGPRDGNCFICNETNGIGLRELNEHFDKCESDCDIDAVNFIHIPDRDPDAKLAAGVGDLIQDLVAPYDF